MLHYLTYSTISKCLLMFSLLLLFSSCTTMHIPVLEESSQSTQVNAELLFINGDFENALLEYEEIYDTALSSEDRNYALYGLACTQLMLARNDHQYIEAISNLHKWDAIKGGAPFTENHHLLILALLHHRDVIQKRNIASAEREKNKNILITKQKKKISKMVHIVKKLQNQLEELEAIDETFQEKRKPL